MLLTSTSGMSESWHTRQGITTVTPFKGLLSWNNGSSRLDLRKKLPQAGDGTTLKLDSDDGWKKYHDYYHRDIAFTQWERPLGWTDDTVSAWGSSGYTARDA